MHKAEREEETERTERTSYEGTRSGYMPRRSSTAVQAARSALSLQ
jgi:hypothetical protein